MPTEKGLFIVRDEVLYSVPIFHSDSKQENQPDLAQTANLGAQCSRATLPNAHTSGRMGRCVSTAPQLPAWGCVHFGFVEPTLVP